MSATTLLITRPRDQAQEWVRRLQEQGVAAAAIPLLEIAPAADPEPVRQACAKLGEWDLVVFVSPNSVHRFLDVWQSVSGPTGWPPGVRAAAPGPGTIEALQQRGVPPSACVQPAADAGQFDSESLWSVLSQQAWAQRRVLIVRGEGGREWLAEQLREAGAQVHYISAYQRLAPALTAPEQSVLQQSLAEPSRYCWLFSSSEAMAHLPTLVQAAGRGWAELAPQMQALATHPRIREQARALGLVQVQACRPALNEVVAQYNARHRAA